MSQGGIEPPSDPCQGSILTIILLGPAFLSKRDFYNYFKNIHLISSYENKISTGKTL